MRIYVISFLSIFLLTALSFKSDTSGHIYKVDVEVAEDLSRMTIDHYDRNGKAVYKGETEFEKFSLEEVNGVLVSFSDILAEDGEYATVTYEPAKSSAANQFGNMASNATGKSKMPYYPKTKLKKVNTDADAFYEIEIDFAYGGGKGRTIVMDKITKLSTIKFSCKVQVSAYDKGGDLLWEKEQTVYDFSEVFSDSSMPYEIGAKWFEVSRSPVVADGQYEQVGDVAAKNVHTDEYWPLSLAEIQSCMELALEVTLES